MMTHRSWSTRVTLPSLILSLISAGGEPTIRQRSHCAGGSSILLRRRERGSEGRQREGALLGCIAGRKLFGQSARTVIPCECSVPFSQHLSPLERQWSAPSAFHPTRILSRGAWRTRFCQRPNLVPFPCPSCLIQLDPLCGITA